MRSHPANAIPPAPQHAIAPQQVWTHLSEQQQQAVRDALTQFVGMSLQYTTPDNPKGNSDGYKFNHE